jgi:hypothetical protein
MADSIVVTQNDRDIATFSMQNQISRFKIDVSDPNIKAFVEHQIEMQATASATIRKYSNIVNMVGK